MSNVANQKHEIQLAHQNGTGGGGGGNDAHQRSNQGQHAKLLPAPFQKSEKSRGDNVDVFQIGDETNANKYPLINQILESNVFQTIVTLLTIFALFGSDTIAITFSKRGDTAFDSITFMCLFIFTVEILLSWVIKPTYRLSFFFWLDLISTLSLILDLQMFQNVVFFNNKSTKAAQLARAGRASRIGTRAGRVVRLVRLIRIVKLYKQANANVEKPQNLLKGRFLEKMREKHKKKRNENQQPEKEYQENGIMQLDSHNKVLEGNGDQPKIRSRNNLERNSVEEQAILNGRQNPNANPKQRGSQGENQDDNLFVVQHNENQQEDLDEDFEESRVSKRLSDMTTKRVIIVMLLLIIFLPMFQSDYFFDMPDTLQYSLTTFSAFCYDKATTNNDIERFYEQIKSTLLENDSPLVLLQTPLPFMENFSDPDFDLSHYRQGDVNTVQIYFDRDAYAQGHPQETDVIEYLNSQSLDSMYIKGVLNNRKLTILDSALSIGRTFFICIVLTLASMFFSKDANDLALRPIERMMKKVNEIARNPLKAKEQQNNQDQEEQEYETTIIENAIVKIGALLALGFGDAGSEIIGQNMKQVGDVNPMIPGRKRVGIYGFCDIRNFTDATEQLQKDVMLFVNNIGEIVHSFVDRYNGAANKNIGDAFLLVWKIHEDKVSVSQSNVITIHDREWMEIQADYAAISFLRIQAQINRRPKILAYRKDVRLTSRMPGYKVKIGYGLHFGWSIEGAIGSDFKIDASYLSPNVNMASKLEGGTKAYGVPILMTSFLADLFTKEMQKIPRKIDHVKVKGFAEPFGLYTFDMKPERLPISKEKVRSTRDQLVRERDKKVIHMQLLDEKTWDAWDYFLNCIDLRIMCLEEQPKVGDSSANMPAGHSIIKKEARGGAHPPAGGAVDVNNVILQANDEVEGKEWVPLNQEFRIHFDEAYKLYTAGKWDAAKLRFELAQHVLAQRGEPEDGPTAVLLEFMESLKYKPPKDWKGIRESNDL